MNKSRLLRRLETSISEAKTSLDADCFRAEKAVYMVRLQKNNEAQNLIAELHSRYDKKPNIKMSIWLNLAEGLSIYFNDMNSAARDKILRSYALSAAANISDLLALTAAWMAQLEYMRHNIEAAATYMKVCLSAAPADHHSARSRASLVAAQALHYAGSYEKAARWNLRARSHAIDEGDDATVSALLHNMAWLNMLAWRQSTLTNSEEIKYAGLAPIGTESTINFDKLVGATTLPTLHPLLQAQVLSLSRSFQEALVLYEKYLDNDKASPMPRLQANLLADRSWCYVQVGSLKEALEDAISAEKSLTRDTHIDDIAATHSRLIQVFEALGQTDEANRHRKDAEQAWLAHHDLQAQVNQTFGELSDVE